MHFFFDRLATIFASVLVFMIKLEYPGLEFNKYQFFLVYDITVRNFFLFLWVIAEAFSYCSQMTGKMNLTIKTYANPIIINLE